MTSEFSDKSFSDAIEIGDLATIKKLIDRQPDVVNHPTWTPPPLHCAILWNQPGAAEILLDNGADIEMLDPGRQTTPLRYAIMYCKTDLIPMLLSRGANTGPIVDGGMTALQLARAAANGKYEQYEDLPAKQNYENVVMTLVESGLNQ